MCSSTYSTTDGSLDQFTFYSYDGAGRVVEEYITDDSGRTADHQYTYTADGALQQVILPSTAEVIWTYGTSGGLSDNDLVTNIARSVVGAPSPTTVIDTVAWNPFGPWASYNWEATIGGTALQNAVARNKSYQITNIYGARTGTSGTVNAEVDTVRDAMNRVTSRIYSPAVTGLANSYYLYDEQSRVICETTDSKTSCPTTGTDIKNNHSLNPPFLAAGDWKQLLRPIPGSTGLTNNFNTSGTTYGTSHQLTDVNQSDGTPTLGHTAMAYDARGERSYDDNTTTLTNDRRDYTYDGRHNLTNVRGQYYTGAAWHYFDVASAYDLKDRRVFKSFYDETSTKTAQWFFYYDAIDRLTEVRYTPDTSSPGTTSVFQLIWLDRKLVAYWETDNPSATTSRRYVASDETDRPTQLWNWPSSGDATRVWAVNQSAWGFDKNIIGPAVYQPILLSGQYQDTEEVAYENDGATIHRPGLAIDGWHVYDPFSGAFLQSNSGVSDYIYNRSRPTTNESDSSQPSPSSPAPAAEMGFEPDSICKTGICTYEVEGYENDQYCCREIKATTNAAGGTSSPTFPPPVYNPVHNPNYVGNLEVDPPSPVILAEPRQVCDLVTAMPPKSPLWQCDHLEGKVPVTCVWQCAGTPTCTDQNNNTVGQPPDDGNATGGYSQSCVVNGRRTTCDYTCGGQQIGGGQGGGSGSNMNPT